MHIPDGFLDLKTAATLTVVSASGLSVALRRVRVGLPRRKIPLMGLAAAFIFAAQMLNFPVAGGTSGHLIGAVLAAVLLGPSAAVVVMTAVLVVQCLLFADGGLVALGANVLNMALVAVVSGYMIFRGVQRLLPTPRGFVVAIAFASWCATVLASGCCALELAVSGVAPWGLVFPAMTTVHMVIGLGEGLITALVVVAIQKTRPDLLLAAAQPSSSPLPRRWIAVGLAVTAALVLFGVPFASSAPDGLEHVAEVLGFSGRAAQGVLGLTPMADYQLPGIGSATAATWVAGLIGSLVVFALAHVLAMILVPRAATPESPSGRA